MNASDLDSEMAAAISRMSDRHVKELVAAGVDPHDIELGLVGVAQGCVEGDIFAPTDGGAMAFITPVRSHFPLTFETPAPQSALRIGDIVDLVAWHPRFPRDWAVRTGAADVLGLIEPQFCGPDAVEVHRAPLGWFRCACRGLVLLSRNPADIYRALSQCVGGLIAEDDAHARELIGTLDRPWPRPPVTVRGAAEARRVS